MQKWLLRVAHTAAVLFLLAAIAGCVLPSDEPTGPGHLTIANDTTQELVFIRWLSSDGTAHYFEPDLVYDEVLEIYVGGMSSGNEATLEVQPGSSPVYFYFAAGGDEYRTQEEVSVHSGKAVRFTLTDSTIVESENPSDRSVLPPGPAGLFELK